MNFFYFFVFGRFFQKNMEIKKKNIFLKVIAKNRKNFMLKKMVNFFFKYRFF